MQLRSFLGLCLTLVSMNSVVGCGGSTAFGSLTDLDASTVADPDTGTVTPMPAEAGVEAAAPEGCRTSLDCPTGKVCDPAAKSCFECVADRDCDSGKTCQEHRCITPVPLCKTNPDCATSTSGKACDAVTGKCVACVVGVDCPTNNDCVANVCKPYTPCVNSLACPKGQVCGTDVGRCVECVGANDCAADQTCAGNTCRPKCASDTQCTKMGQLCDTARGYCVACVGATDCKPEEFCSNGTCARDVCTAGSSSCDVNTVVTCRSDGSGFGAPSACGAQQTCVASQGVASCKDRICTPSVVACDTQSEKVIQCSADGLSFTAKLDCGATNQVCIAAKCAPVVCQAGKQYCEAGTVRKCSAKGEMSTLVQTCTAGQFCEAASATCKPQVCTPNLPACNVKIATTCNADGSGYLVGGIDCGVKNCSGGACVDCNALTEVAYNGHCYYLDGSGGTCDAGYSLASQSLFPTIGASFIGKTYKHTLSGNCCVFNADANENYGMAHCNAAGTFGAGDPSLGAAGCTNQFNKMAGQLTFCGSL